MKLKISCELDYLTKENVPLILMLRPRSGAGQWVSKEEYLFIPNVRVAEYTDSYGNICQRMIAPEGNFSIKTTAVVETNDELEVNFVAEFVPVEQLPNEILIYILPSRYCESDKLANLALEIAGNLPMGYAQVDAIRQWVKDHILFEYGHSTTSTSAQDTLQNRKGVCRDFSHLCIALCRSLNIPARMVVGYLHELKPMDLHAWFEAYLGGKWYTFDATQATPKGSRVVLAQGRDAADVALATQFGEMALVNMSVAVEVAE